MGKTIEISSNSMNRNKSDMSAYKDKEVLWFSWKYSFHHHENKEPTIFAHSEKKFLDPN